MQLVANCLLKTPGILRINIIVIWDVREMQLNKSANKKDHFPKKQSELLELFKNKDIFSTGHLKQQTLRVQACL